MHTDTGCQDLSIATRCIHFFRNQSSGTFKNFQAIGDPHRDSRSIIGAIGCGGLGWRALPAAVSETSTPTLAATEIARPAPGDSHGPELGRHGHGTSLPTQPTPVWLTVLLIIWVVALTLKLTRVKRRTEDGYLACEDVEGAYGKGQQKQSMKELPIVIVEQEAEMLPLYTAKGVLY